LLDAATAAVCYKKYHLSLKQQPSKFPTKNNQFTVALQ
jgi:hypothetical protein